MGSFRDKIVNALPWIEPVLDYFDWRKRAVALVAAVAIGVWSFVKDLPWPTIIVLGLGTLVLTAYALAFPAFIRLINVGVKARPNHAIWKHRKQFRLDEAACLLADVEPVHSYAAMDGDSKAWLSLLREAVEFQEIKRVIGNKFHEEEHTIAGRYRADEDTIIVADEFRKFCDLRARKPEFLQK